MHYLPRLIWGRLHVCELSHFGQQILAQKDVPILADPTTTAVIRTDGEGLAENLYRLVGEGMHGTESVPPPTPLPLGRQRIGGHDFEFIAVTGHTPADIAVFDRSTDVLYAIDQVLNQRTPTLPRASIPAWLTALDTLAALPFKVLVSGHGLPTPDAAPIAATRDSLVWLDDTLRHAAEQGLSPNEVMALPLPDRFAHWAEARDEWRRSVGFLYAQYERAALPLLEAVYDLANDGSAKAKFGKKAQLTRGQCACFLRISTQDHPSLADRK